MSNSTTTATAVAPQAAAQKKKQLTIFEAAEYGDFDAFKDQFATVGHNVFENVRFMK